ncbi:MAG: triose-phosphate isomerase [Paracoccaceae bacterium]
MPRRPLVAGNWKMNGLASSRSELDAMVARIDGSGAEVLVCPPFTLLWPFVEAAAGTPVKIGAQDCHAAPKGAHTGDVSAEQLADTGAVAVILGHSERRADHGESDEIVRDKVEAAWRAGLQAIVCVGETEAERDAGRALEVVERQLRGSLPEGATAASLVVAYEPVWAIGTGRTAESGDIAEMHDRVREVLVELMSGNGEDVRLLYGGSVKPANAAEIFALGNVDGGLVGGASLKADDFLGIVGAAG